MVMIGDFIKSTDKKGISEYGIVCKIKGSGNEVRISEMHDGFLRPNSKSIRLDFQNYAGFRKFLHRIFKIVHGIENSCTCTFSQTTRLFSKTVFKVL